MRSFSFLLKTALFACAVSQNLFSDEDKDIADVLRSRDELTITVPPLFLSGAGRAGLENEGLADLLASFPSSGSELNWALVTAASRNNMGIVSCLLEAASLAGFFTRGIAAGALAAAANNGNVVIVSMLLDKCIPLQLVSSRMLSEILEGAVYYDQPFVVQMLLYHTGTQALLSSDALYAILEMAPQDGVNAPLLEIQQLIRRKLGEMELLASASLHEGSLEGFISIMNRNDAILQQLVAAEDWSQRIRAHEESVKSDK